MLGYSLELGGPCSSGAPVDEFSPAAELFSGVGEALTVVGGVNSDACGKGLAGADEDEPDAS
jgi:hypothetical protein